VAASVAPNSSVGAVLISFPFDQLCDIAYINLRIN
jgi:hypothetical protein